MAGFQTMNELPDGVLVRPLTPNVDSRGALTEIFRESWDLGCRPVQFNAVSSAASVLRGVHVHVRHTDHLVVVAGRMALGLHDLRPWSPTARKSCLFDIVSNAPRAIVIPVGVAHGFYFCEPSLMIYGTSHYWDKADEIACRWNCPELELAWPTTSPILSPRDAAAEGYSAFCSQFECAWMAVHGTRTGRSPA
jgi:dTDP-4-dehydrorhamnose 3,5-epimerase